MIDLHTHTIFSDGELIPAELARRAEALGLSHVALTDHVDPSNLDLVVPRLAKAAALMNTYTRVRIIPGAELTHVPPPLIESLVKQARELGAAIVLVHGQTPVEPVAEGTNLAAIRAGADILAHPGLITEQEARLARERGVALEITARAGHSLTNGHVARLAKAVGAAMVLNTDTHAPSDLIGEPMARTVALGAGLGVDDFAAMTATSLGLAKKSGLG